MTFINHKKKGKKNIILLLCDECDTNFFAKKGTSSLKQELHFCSEICRKKSLAAGSLKKKIQQNNMEKYGSISPLASDEIRLKIEQTNLEKYGVTNPILNVEIQEKIKKTNMEKYGSFCSLNDEVVKGKRQLSWNQKYGGHPLADKKIRLKIEQTNLEKYGSEIFTSSQYFKETLKNNNLEKYGVASVLSIPEVREKIKKTNIEKYGRETYVGSTDHQSKINYDEIVKKAWETKIKNGSCSKSKPEEKLNLLLVSYFGEENVMRQVRMIKQWIDFYIKTLDLYLQVDGVYWHGLNRDIEIIKQGITLQDRKIYKQILRDEKLNQYMKINKMKLVRITDNEINSQSEDEILKKLLEKTNATI